MVITVKTSDRVIWNRDSVIIDLCSAMLHGEPVLLSLNQEGPDIVELGLDNIIVKCATKFNYDISNLQIVNDCNLIQSSQFQTKYLPPMHFVDNTRNYATAVETKDMTHHFGMFIGRSNQHRLNLASHLYNKHKDKTIQTYHYDPTLDFHKNNVGLEDLLTTHQSSIVDVTKLIANCPITLDQAVTYPILMDQHLKITEKYKSFFVEVACETYYSGQTFFPTEKTWRAISQLTPFIIQGSCNYLANLKRLGFQTFNNWWDEGYAEDPADWQPEEIKNTINYLAQKDIGQLKQMYQEMMPVLEHNFSRLQNLMSTDFYKLKNE